ncbi:MAG: 50S ribosomal protein L11 methyltransferase, partial [Caulobacterales bacterium]|nr:50S ribosomal protein L11 methyltransferase [Caulobacterales bacterium]
RGARFDLIFANVLAGPLIGLSGYLTRATAPGGRVVLSGVLAEQARSVEAAYRARGLARERRLIREGWATIVFARSDVRGSQRRGAITPRRRRW